MRLLIAFHLALLASHSHAAGFKEIVTFGDSLTDMGNRSIKPGMTEVKSRETWVKQLAGPGMLDIPDFKPSGMTSYFGGTNYAIGGSTTEYAARMGKDANKAQNLTVQISGRYLNPAFNTDGVKKDALHIIRIGTNDLMAVSIQPQHIATAWANLDQEAVKISESVEGQIQALAAAGARYVMWGNLSDGGKFPSVVRRVTMLGPEMAATALAAMTKACDAFNTEMDAAIVRLEKAHEGLEIIKLDLNAKFLEIAADPAKYGFADITVGANDSKHLFSADGLHPTPAGHKMLAKYAFEVLSAPDTPRPN